MILAIAVATMITVAIVVFAMQYYAYRKNHGKREKVRTPNVSAGAQETPIAS